MGFRMLGPTTNIRHMTQMKRLRFVASLISQSLRRRRTALYKSAKKANRLRTVNKDMKAWEALNGYDD